MSINLETLGRMVRDRRKSLKIAQDELAKLVGTSQGYISNLEKGKQPNPTTATLNKIAQALHMDVEELTKTSTEPIQVTRSTSADKLSILLNQLLTLPEETIEEICRTLEALIKYHQKH
jgi:transcriptional regulator with XRE-family HTH domain